MKVLLISDKQATCEEYKRCANAAILFYIADNFKKKLLEGSLSKFDLKIGL